MNISLMKRLLVAFLAIVLLWIAWFEYPTITVKMSGSDIPKNWKVEFSGKSYAEVIAILGPPGENLSAKGLQVWVRNEWWGKYILTVAFESCCNQFSISAGSSIVGIVYMGFDRSKRIVVSNNWNDPTKQGKVPNGSE